MARAASQVIVVAHLPRIDVPPVLASRQAIGAETGPARQPGQAAVAQHADCRPGGEPESAPDHRRPAS